MSFWVIFAILAINAGVLTLQMAHIRSFELDEQTRSYMLYKLKFTLLSFIFSVVLFWVLINASLLNNIREVLGQFQNDYILLLAVLALIYLVNALLHFVKTFYIEQRFGFNQSSVRLFVSDGLKKLLLNVSLGLPVAFCALWLADWSGQYWWFSVWCLSVVALMGYSLVSHSIALRFNHFNPLRRGSLRQRVERLVRDHHVNLDNIFVVDKSQRSSHSNAYFSGIGRTKRIVIDDTLIQQLNDDEIIAVLAHELGHYKLNHELKLYSILALTLLAMFFLTAVFIEHTSLTGLSDYSPVIVFVIAFPILYFVFQPIIMMFSRHCEFDADSFAIDQSMARWLYDALEKLNAANKMVASSNRWYSIFYESHPTIELRLQRLKESK